MRMPVFTMIASMLMLMTLTVGAMLMSMLVLVRMFMVVRLGRSMHVFMPMDVLMSMGAFHGGTPYQAIV